MKNRLKTLQSKRIVGYIPNLNICTILIFSLTFKVFVTIFDENRIVFIFHTSLLHDHFYKTNENKAIWLL